MQSATLDRTAAIRQDFPILQRVLPNGSPLIYLDNAASSQKPASVIRTMDDYYRRYNANVHRGVHTLSEEATAAFEATREKVARFINAPSARNIIYTSGTTASINLVAYTWGRANLKPGDEVLITEMEHHANIVPWQIVQEQLGFTIRYVPVTDRGTLDLERLPDLLTERTKLFSFVHASNVVGTINPVRELVAAARAVGAKVLIDGAQSVPHMPVDVQALDADFLALSGHKMLGPMGSGALYGKLAFLEGMPPFMGGGGMIRKVSFTRSTWADVPARFEAGTPAVGDAIGLGAAVDYLSDLGMDNVQAHERNLTALALDELRSVPELVLYGPPDIEDHAGVVSFRLGDIHPHDVAAILNEENIAVRAGHHCCQPLMDRLELPATTRASFYVYNDASDVDRLVAGLQRARDIFGA